MADVIGPRASGTTINIASDADWVLNLRSEGAAFDLDAVISVRFPIDAEVITWEATIDTGDPHRAMWNVDETDVAELLTHGKPKTARLHYERGTVDLLWDVWRVAIV